MLELLILDLAQFEHAPNTKACKTLNKALVEYGFLVLAGHDTNMAPLEDFRRLAITFSARPKAEKARFAPLHGQPYGWIAIGREALGRTP